MINGMSLSSDMVRCGSEAYTFYNKTIFIFHWISKDMTRTFDNPETKADLNKVAEDAARAVAKIAKTVREALQQWLNSTSCVRTQAEVRNY
jgi:hypothetical protein